MYMVGAMNRTDVVDGDNKEMSPHSWYGKQILWPVIMQN